MFTGGCDAWPFGSSHPLFAIYVLAGVRCSEFGSVFYLTIDLGALKSKEFPVDGIRGLRIEQNASVLSSLFRMPCGFGVNLNTTIPVVEPKVNEFLGAAHGLSREFS